MKVLLILASFGMLAAAVPQYQNYGAPAQQSYAAPAPQQGYSQQASSGGYQQQQQSGGYQSGPQEQKVHKHVYVHVAPQEAPEPKAPRAPRIAQVPEKHYKILFIRAPEPAPYQEPDIPELPPAPEQKTLVYVLLKKPDATPAITLPTAAPTKPSKPEVYFIRYKSPEQEQRSQYGPPAPVPQQAYGSPQPQPSSQYGSPSGRY